MQAVLPVLLLLLASLGGVQSILYCHPNSDARSGVHKPNRLRIQAFTDLTSSHSYFGLTHAAGYLVWRDWINAQGGLCLSANGGASGCTENDKGENYRLLVSLRVLDWAKDEDEVNGQKALTDEVKRLCHEAESQRPHFIIAPYSHVLSQIVSDAVIKEGTEEKGCNIPIFFHVQDDNFFQSSRIFQFSPYPSSANFMIPALEYYSERHEARTFVVLSPSYGESVFQAQQAFDQIQAYNKTKLHLLMRRCSNDATNIYANNCMSDGDCPTNSTCTFARYDETIFYLNRFREKASNWMDKIIEADPDVVVLTDYDGITAFVDLAKSKEWRARGVMVTEPSGLRYFNNIPSVYWTVFTPYAMDLNTGVQGKYMGRNEEYLETAVPLIKKRPPGIILSLIPLLTDAHSSAIGISIQRAVEFSFIGTEESRYNPLKNPFNDAPFKKLINSLTMTGECGYSKEASGEISATGQLCQTQVDCGSGVQCFEWENFFGVIHFNSRGVNIGGNYLVLQFFASNASSPLHANVVGPSTTSICNAKGDCIAERKWDCNCPGYYPAPFAWKAIPQKIPVTLGGSSFIAITSVAGAIAVVYIVCIAFIISNTKNIIIAELPPGYSVLVLFSVIALPSYIFYTIEPNSIICPIRNAVYIFSTSSMLIACSFACESLLYKYRKVYLNPKTLKFKIFGCCLLVIVLYIAFCFISGESAQVVYYSNGDIRKSIVQCQVSSNRFLISTTPYIVLLFSQKAFLPLFKEFRSKSDVKLVLSVMLSVILCTVLVAWVLELLPYNNAYFLFSIGIVKSFVNVYENMQRKKEVIKMNLDQNYLESIIIQPISRAYFKEFLKGKQLEHFVDCYIHICLFKQEPPGGEKQEYEEFIHESFVNLTPYSVNVPQNVVEDIKKRLKKNDNSVFDRVLKSIIQNLQVNDVYSEYLMSSYAFHAQRFEDLLMVERSRDTRIIDILREITFEKIEKRIQKKQDKQKKGRRTQKKG